MTVKDLIKELLAMPMNAHVVYLNYSTGAYSDIEFKARAAGAIRHTGGYWCPTSTPDGENVVVVDIGTNRS